MKNRPSSRRTPRIGTQAANRSVRLIIGIAGYRKFQSNRKTEVNAANTYRLNMISTLVLISKFLKHKPHNDMTREDILDYLDSLRKPEGSDPFHKWIGSYNVKRQII